MKIYTIGFTKKTAKRFFGLLRESGAERLVDVRLRNTSGLSGFAKRDDLAWFLRELCKMDYIHLPRLAPTGEMLDAYRKEHKSWEVYEREFLALIEERRIAKTDVKRVVDNSVLLCSETSPSIVIVGWLSSICNGIGAQWKLSICKAFGLSFIEILQPD